MSLKCHMTNDEPTLLLFSVRIMKIMNLPFVFPKLLCLRNFPKWHNVAQCLGNHDTQLLQ